MTQLSGGNGWCMSAYARSKDAGQNRSRNDLKVTTKVNWRAGSRFVRSPGYCGVTTGSDLLTAEKTV